MKKKILLIGLCLLLISGCGKVPKLENGKDAIITFKNHEISVDDLYEELKTNFGLEATLKLIDTYVLEKEFKDYKDDAQEQAESYIESYKNMLGSEENLLNYIKQSTNYTTIEGYQESIYKSVMESHATEEYAKTLVTDKEIEDYYKKEIKGDVLVYHILITPKVEDETDSASKTTAETDAKETAKEIIKKLDKAKNSFETFKELVKEYSEDEDTKSKDGKLGYINYGDLDSLYDPILDEAYELKDGTYSKNVITTSLGYHIIYRKNTKEKDALKDIKDSIVSTLSSEKIAEDATIPVEAMKHYRKKYDMQIHDDTLERQYGIYLNNLANQ